MTSTILEARGVSKRFGGLQVLKDVSVGLRANTLHSIIGPNGAGKSTLFDVLAGVQSPDSGRVLLEGDDVTRSASWRRARAGIARKFQAPSVYRELTIADNVQAAACGGLSVPRLVARRRAAPLGDEILDRLGLAGLENTMAGELSHGGQQRLELAMTLATRPRVLLLDEPAAGASQSERVELMRLLRELVQDVSLFVVQHDLRFIREVSDEVTVLDRGRVIAHGSVDEVAGDSAVRSVFLGRQTL